MLVPKVKECTPMSWCCGSPSWQGSELFRGELLGPLGHPGGCGFERHRNTKPGVPAGDAAGYAGLCAWMHPRWEAQRCWQPPRPRLQDTRTGCSGVRGSAAAELNPVSPVLFWTRSSERGSPSPPAQGEALQGNRPRRHRGCWPFLLSSL